MENQNLKIGYEIWFMRDNKPLCCYVWEIIHREFFTHKSNYGVPYDHEIKYEWDYILRDKKDNSHESNAFSLQVMLDAKVKFFRTKKELIDSL